MNADRTKVQIWAFALLLFSLAVKGVQDASAVQGYALVSTPAALAAFKDISDYIAIASLAVYAGAAFVTANGLSLRIMPIIHVLVLCYYYLRSYHVGSGDSTNLAAVPVVLLFLAALLLQDTNQAKEILVKALGIFFATYIVLSILLFVAGYGYTTSGARFAGMTSHPNSHGAYAALAAGYFSAQLILRKRRSRSLSISAILLAASIAMAMLSGSRSAVLMVLAALGLALPMNRKIMIGAAVLASVLLAFFALNLVSPDSAISSALNRMQAAPTDNRNEVWSVLITDFYDYPFAGAGDRSGVSGSGYLSALSGCGVVLGGLFIANFLSATATAAIGIFKQLLSKLSDSDDAIFSVLLIQTATGSLFEAFLFDKFGLIQLLTVGLLFAGSRRLRTGSKSRSAAKSIGARPD